MMYRVLRKIPVLLFIASALLSASTFDIVSGALALFLPDSSGMEKSGLHYHVDHQELFRTSRPDTLLSRYTLRRQHASFTHVQGKSSYHAAWTRSVYRISDLFQSDYTFTGSLPVSHSFHVKLKTHKNRWTLQSGVKYAFSKISDTLFVTDFPLSEQTAYNTYFFSLLPQTFGDKLPYTNSANAFSADIFAHKNNNEQSLLFYLEYSGLINKLRESHINTSGNNLNGPRESLCRFNYSGIRGLAAWKINNRSMVWLGANYHFIPLEWNHTVFPDQPDTLEIVNIARGKAHALNIQAAYRLLSFPYNLKATLAGGAVKNHTAASTPVLGYVLRILPISHQANIDLRGKYMLAHLHVDYPLKSGRSVFTPRIDLIAARVWSDISIQALLQFGLEDVDIEESYIHAVYIGSLGLNGRIALNRDLFLIVEADQLIPFIKTVYPVQPPPIPDDISRYGGLSVKAGISMTW